MNIEIAGAAGKPNINWDRIQLFKWYNQAQDNYYYVLSTGHHINDYFSGTLLFIANNHQSLEVPVYGEQWYKKSFEPVEGSLTFKFEN